MIVTIEPKNHNLVGRPALATERTRPASGDELEAKIRYMTAPTCQGTNSLSP
jgi:hypothetical protein